MECDVRCHAVISRQTQALQGVLEAMSCELGDGTASACGKVSEVMTRLMAHFDCDTRIEGVLTRYQFMAEKHSTPESR
ncbi:hypothetical protein [Chitinimonas sp. BJB300]|uniref:hypothetical protein n=1 Tax=Chitinimonas sp. BJB300 TaxID=1559339 RepID=UPI000C10E740|nr:hypothetical protein [Chitinimonas sp. BJB300]PHV11889.1 hypothetical protein CSQ89_08490 [Chitinimonas sp. BJB300]TSJ91468.1 hypothetical protein FG002_004105 [Chitinimonas sp. BJB300]